MPRIILLLVAILFAAGLTARVFADAPASGIFTASQACPALASIRKGTNPGNVTVAPQQGYQVVSANNVPATHYLVIVAGAEPQRRWVAVDCGRLAAGAATPASASQPRLPAGLPNRPTPGTPTRYVLSVSWEPGFCASHGDKSECAAETPTGFDASHFTLHGLWPDPNEYCGAAAGDIAADKAGDWQALPAVDLSASTRSHLAQAMPGTQSLLERHEWLKHGSCSGIDADGYFGRALSFLDSVNASPLQALFAGAVGHGLTLDAIRAAADSRFGNGAGQRVRVSCSRDNGIPRITELTFGLEGDVAGGAALPALIAASRPTNGGCDTGLVSAVN